ncbi:hypothetical protein HK102_008286 [Quaeritorhiza haematococci]|nr:hypothetical protein HK102_008286 [Quaeritorhiza haematococci]
MGRRKKIQTSPTKGLAEQEGPLGLHKLIEVVRGEDVNGICNLEDEENTQDGESVVTLLSIEEKAKAGQYKSISRFQEDFDLAMSAVIQQYSPDSGEFETATSIWQFGTRLINREAENIPADSDDDGGDTGVKTRRKSRRAGKVDETDKTFRGQKISLVQKGPDGSFYFSGSVRKPPFESGGLPMSAGVNKLNVIPTYSSPNHIPKLGPITPAPKVPPAPKPNQIEVAPVEFLDADIFSSFGPTADSNQASLSQSESIYYNKRKCIVKRESLLVNAVVDMVEVDDIPPVTTSSSDSIKIDESVKEHFKEEGIDVSLILDTVTSSEKQRGDDEKQHKPGGGSAGIDKTKALLWASGKLIEELQEHQNRRYLSGKHELSDEEINLVQSLEEVLAILVREAPPSQLVSKQALENAMLYLQRLEPAYRGVLPPSKPFVFPSNLVGQPAFPLNAGSIPPTGDWRNFIHAPAPGMIPQQPQQALAPPPPPTPQTGVVGVPPTAFRPPYTGAPPPNFPGSAPPSAIFTPFKQPGPPPGMSPQMAGYHPFAANPMMATPMGMAGVGGIPPNAMFPGQRPVGMPPPGGMMPPNAMAMNWKFP